MLAGADDARVAALSGYGLPLGEAFQLRDDVLGVFGDPEQTGKPAGDDLREGKRTMLVAVARQNSTPQQEATLRRHLGDPRLSAAKIDQLRQVIVDTGALEHVEELIAALVDQAQTALAAAPVDEATREVLADLVGAATARQT